MAIQGASLTPIYDRLHSVGKYHPMSANTFADWSVEAGDIISISRGNDIVTAPIHNTKIVWRGSPQITLNSTGNEERDNIARTSKRKYGRSGAGMRNERVIRTEMYSADSMLYAYIELTETYILSVVDDTANDLGSAILQTASQIRSEVHASNSQLYSYVNQTATHILSVVEDTANDLGSAILQTASQIRSEVHAANSQLYSYIDQTATYILSVVDDTANDLGSAILQTASQIRSEVHASNSQLYSYIDQTATYILSVVDDTANDLGSAILQTASQIRSEVHASNSQLYSYIDQTATYIEQSVASTESSLRGAISVQANRISLVVEGTGSNAKIKAAQIVASINDTESSVLIEADKVLISGSTTISGALTISDGNLVVKKSATFQGNVQLTTADSFVQAPIFGVPSNGKIRFNGTSAGETYNLTTNILKGMVKEFSVSGNTLTLTPFYGDPVNFSKATTLAGSWGSGSGGEIRYRVVASPQGSANYATVFVENGTASKNANWQTMVDIPVKIRSYVNGSETAVDTGYENTLHVNVNDLLQAKTGTDKITANGTYTADSDHIGFGSVEIDVPAGYTNVKTQFNSSPDGYYIVATDGSGGAEISNSSTYYQLGTSGSNASTKVQVQNTSGTRINNTPELSVGSLYTEGQNSVNIIKGSWDTDNARIQFTKSAGTANTQGVRIGANQSWSNGNFTATIKDYYDNPEGVDTGYRVTTDIGTPSSTNPAAKPSTESIAGRTQIGTGGISKAGLSGPGYIFFSITVRGKELKYYIVVNP